NTNYLNYKMGNEIDNIFISIKKWKNSPVNPKNLDNALNKVFAPISDEKLSQIVASHTFQNWYQSEQVSWELKENNKTPKIFYRGLNDIDNADELKASNQYGEYAGEYYADDPATAASYIEEFANGKIIAGFLNIPQEKLAVIDCNGHS
ncbi:MAG: hypothetical protein J6W29_02680, partial [Neisseriaceae bacterium]|nr:hypothetical protein [Neisseriaceae bacterium]